MSSAIPEDIRIRSANAADAAALAELARRTFADAFAATNDAGDMELYMTEAFGLPQQTAQLADPNVQTLLCDIDGRLAAYAQLRQGDAPSCVHGPRKLELWRFYVDAAWHGRGIAQELMARVLRAATAAGATTLWLSVWEHNPRAVAFYRKHGFVHVGEHAFVLGTDRQTDWVMARALD